MGRRGPVSDDQIAGVRSGSDLNAASEREQVLADALRMVVKIARNSRGAPNACDTADYVASNALIDAGLAVGVSRRASGLWEVDRG